MITTEEWDFDGQNESLFATAWKGDDDPKFIAVLVHGYGEHIGRYVHVAEALVQMGGVVYGLDHVGHGRSGGDRAVIADFAPVVADVDALVDQAREVYASLPVVMIGHSMGGLIAARYAQVHGDRLVALVLSGPAVGNMEMLSQLSQLDEIPDIPIDPSVLSRDESVGAAYAADELVYHGPFHKQTVAAFVDAIKQVNAGGRLTVPLLWIHGEEDQLVPIDGARTGIEIIAGDGFAEKSYPSARHEVFNEVNNAEVISDVTNFLSQFVGD